MMGETGAWADRMADEAKAAVGRLKSARVKELYDYWCAKRGDRAMPGRDDIDPAEIKALLPYVLLTDVHHQPPRVFIRLVGTAVAEAAGRNLTGQWLHEAQLEGGV